jgi:3-dehydroquinate dehydratase-1
MLTSFKICSIVEGSTLPTFTKNLAKLQKTSEMVELRSDFIKGMKVDYMPKLKTKGTTIFTCRSVREGGNFSGSLSEQEAILKEAFVSGFTYVDVAYDNPLIDELTPKDKKKLLISYHNFKSTPASIELMSVIEKMREHDPAVIKIATMVKKANDMFTLVEILRQKKDKEKFVVIGMGEEGRLTRVMFPMMGSYLIYVSDNSKLLSGIMKRKDIESIYKIVSKS